MRFYSLSTTTIDKSILESDYKNAREIGIVHLGDKCLFFRRRMKKYYAAYSDISRAFRRVMSVPAKLCCGKGEFIIENLVIYIDEKEVAEIQLPGTKAAKILMEELKMKAPDAQFIPLQENKDEVTE